ncbi:MAG: hypothetical protein VKL59_09935 [Nostocaceae cyanobacterium]|nr:hypothetical protein [Nostocaceae cyanobacterium]
MSSIPPFFLQLFKIIVSPQGLCTIAGAVGGYKLGEVMVWIIGDTFMSIFPQPLGGNLYNIGDAIYPWLGMAVGSVVGNCFGKKFGEKT